MLLHEKMRLQRKINKLTLKQLHLGNVQDRMQKKIDRREKYYSKLEKQLERQANAYKNSANMYFSNMMGLGTNSVNLGNYMGSSAAALQMIDQWGGVNPLDSSQSLSAEDQEKLKLYMCGAFQYDSTNQTYKAGKYTLTKDEYTNGQLQKWASIANSQVTQMQTYASQMKSNYENQVSIWLEAQQEELEAQKEWEMDLLEEEQSDMEADKTSVEAQLELAKQRKEAIEQELGNSIKDAAPKFGLG